MQEVVIDIDEQGNVTTGVRGVSGPDCEKLTGAIEEALGAVTSRTKTADYAKRPIQVTRKAGA